MNVTIVKADPSRLAECREVFLDSALYDHYFTAEGRLEGMLATAVEKGELWLAVTSQNEVAGAMWIEMTGFFDVFPYLALLGVKKSFRGMGVGHVLLRTFEGVRIFGTHGHRYGVKQGLIRFSLAAQEQQAQVALFGHTHIPYCRQEGGLWLLNPGACGGRAPSCGIVTVDGGKAVCCVKDLLLEETL